MDKSNSFCFSVAVAFLLLLVGANRWATAQSLEEYAKLLRSRHDAVRKDAYDKLLNASPDEIGKLVPLLSEGLRDDSSEVRFYCSEVLKRCGSKAKAAIPALIQSLNNEEDNAGTRHNVAATLVAIGEPSVPQLVTNLKKARGWSWRIRLQTIEVLGDIGPPAKGALPELLKETGDTGFPEVGIEAAHAIVRIARDDSECVKVAVPVLVRGLELQSPKEQAFRAAESLSRLGKQGKPAVPLLIKILRDGPEPFGLSPKGGYSFRAAFALWEFGAVANEAAPDLNRILNDRTHYGDEGLRMLVAGALLRIDESNDTARSALEDSLALLIHGLTDANPGMPVFAAKTLGSLGSKARSALPALKLAAKKDDKKLRETASRAIELIEQAGKL